MNVIGSRPDGWWRDRDRAMATLVWRLELWKPPGDAVTVVFERPPSPPAESDVITVTHAPRVAANAADDEIVRLVQTADDPAGLCVVTSDRGLIDRVSMLGASVYPAQRLRDLIDPR